MSNGTLVHTYRVSLYLYSLIRICIALRLSNNESFICICTQMLLFMSAVLSSLTTYNNMDEHYDVLMSVYC